MHTEFYHSKQTLRVCGVRSNYSQLCKDFPLHGHDYYEFEVVIAGEGTHVVNGVAMQVGAGDCWALCPEDYHLMRSQHIEILNLRFYRSELPPMVEAMLDGHTFPLSGRLIQELDIFEGYFQCFSRISPDGRYMEEEGLSYAMLMLVTLFRVFHPASAEPTYVAGLNYVKQAVEYLHAHYAESVCLDDVANAINISPGYISSLFGEYAGCSFVKFLRQLRVDKATTALLETDESVIQIAYNCGFGSISNFDRAFRAVVGQSPSDFRKQYHSDIRE